MNQKVEVKKSNGQPWFLPWPPQSWKIEVFTSPFWSSLYLLWEKKCFFHKKYKDDQNGLIHPERWKFWFFITWGVRAEITAISQTFWLPLFGSKNLKEADIKFFFKVFAKFNDNKHKKDIKKLWNFYLFFHRRGGKFWWKIP